MRGTFDLRKSKAGAKIFLREFVKEWRKAVESLSKIIVDEDESQRLDGKSGANAAKLIEDIRFAYAQPLYLR